MKDYRIVTDSAWDLNHEAAEDIDVRVVPFSVTLDGTNYGKEGIDLVSKDVYDYEVANPSVFPKTAQPSVEDFYEAFKEEAEKGRDVLCLTLSSRLTGSVNAARLAASMLADECPETRIEVLDSRLACIAQGLLIKELFLMKQKGLSLDELLEQVDQMIDDARIFFTVGDLTYLIAGGRIGKAVGMGANILNVKPVLVLKEGELHPGGLAHGRKKAIHASIDMTMKYLAEKGFTPESHDFIVGYGYDESEGEKVAEQLRKELLNAYPDMEAHIDCSRSGCVIGVYTGPYPLGIALVKKA